MHTCICTQPHVCMYTCTHTHVQTHTHRMKSRVWRYQQLIRLQDSERLPWEAQSHGCRHEDWGAVGAAGIGCSDSTVLARFNLPASSCLINHSSNINFPCISLIFLWIEALGRVPCVCKERWEQWSRLWSLLRLAPSSPVADLLLTGRLETVLCFQQLLRASRPCNWRTMFGRLWASSLRPEVSGQSALAEPWPGSLLGVWFS